MTTDGQSDWLIRLNHRETLQAATEALELPVDERALYGLTLAVDRKKLPLLAKRLRTFIDQIQAEFCLDPTADTVYRIQAQCFPLAEASRPKGAN